MPLLIVSLTDVTPVSLNISHYTPEARRDSSTTYNPLYILTSPSVSPLTLSSKNRTTHQAPKVCGLENRKKSVPTDSQQTANSSMLIVTYSIHSPFVAFSLRWQTFFRYFLIKKCHQLKKKLFKLFCCCLVIGWLLLLLLFV